VRVELPGSAKPTTWRNRTVIGMGLTSFFSDLGHETATAILPLFLASIGAPPAALGAIEGVSDAASSFVKLGAGWIGDRVRRRKPIIVGGYAVTGIATALFGLATVWPHILVSRAIGWCGRGIRGPLRDAMLSDSVEPRVRGRAFGFERAGDTLGAVVGPVLAILLLSAFTYRQIFLATLLPGLLAALSFAVLVRERGRSSIRPRKFWEALGALPPRFRLFLVGVAIFGAGDFAHTLLILRAAQALTPTLGTAPAGTFAVGLYTVHNVLYAAASYPMGALGDRYDKRAVLAGGYLLAALMSVGFIFAFPSVWMLALLFGVGGLYIAIEDTLERAIAADLLPEDLRSTGYGVLATANGLGDLASSLVVGVLWTVVGPTAGFAYAAGLSVIGAAIVFRVR
jgi:MFS family permease